MSGALAEIDIVATDDASEVFQNQLKMGIVTVFLYFTLFGFVASFSFGGVCTMRGL